MCRLRFDFLQKLFWFMDTEIFIVALASTVHVTEKKGDIYIAAHLTADIILMVTM